MQQMPGHGPSPQQGWAGQPSGAGNVANPALMGYRAQPPYAGGTQMPPQPQPFNTELMLLQDERIRNHREALKQRLQLCGGLGLEELEFAVRMMLMSGRFAGSQVSPCRLKNVSHVCPVGSPLASRVRLAGIYVRRVSLKRC
jgi:hypothetical protein